MTMGFPFTGKPIEVIKQNNTQKIFNSGKFNLRIQDFVLIHCSSFFRVVE